MVRVNGSARLVRPGLAWRQVGLLLIAAAGAWAATVVLSRGMSGMAGTMGLGLAVFVPVWTLMMAAMMLPSVTPTASLYARTVQSNRTARIALLVLGYLAVWAAAGVPAFGLAWLTGWLTGKHPGAAHVLAVAVFAACGVYQLSRLKDRCLAHCRSPLALLLHYGSYRGRFRDMRAGAHNGAYCLGCCWGLMVILVAVGVMNHRRDDRPGRRGADREDLEPRPGGEKGSRRRRAGLGGSRDLASGTGSGPARRPPDDDGLTGA